MKQVAEGLPPSDVSVEKVASQVTAMIAERAKEALATRKLELVKPTVIEPTVEHEVGVYFGLDAASYHRDSALGSTDIKALSVHPAFYWANSALNPDRTPRVETPAMRIGSALHKLVLEGEKAFDKTYTCEPRPEDFPGALVSLEHLKGRCRELCEAVSGTKSELAKRIRLKDPKTIIFDDIAQTHRAMSDRDGLEILKSEHMTQVRSAAKYIASNPHLAKAFKGGASEVSVFWEEDGVRCKCRLDVLKPRAVVDLKSFSAARGRPVDEAVLMAIAAFRYDLQCAHYLDGYRELFKLARHGRVFGNCPLPAGWNEKIATPDEVVWTWVFFAVDCPIVLGRQITPDSTLLNRAKREVATAKANYREYLDAFGAEPWTCTEPIVELTDKDLPRWLRTETTEEVL